MRTRRGQESPGPQADPTPLESPPAVLEPPGAGTHGVTATTLEVRPRAGEARSAKEKHGPEPLMRFWDVLSAPWSAVSRPEDRRRAQMIAGLVLVMVSGAIVLMFLVPMYNDAGAIFTDPGLLLANILLVAGGLGIYMISRTRYYEWSAWLMVFGTMAWVSVGVVAAEGTPWYASAPLYLALTVVLSTVLLPLMATLFVVALNLGLLLAFYRFLPAFGVIELSNAMTFLAIASTVLIVTALVRYFDIRQIEDQSADIQESEERYRSLFEASFEGLALHADGKVMEANQALADMFRTTRDNVVGMPISTLVPPEASKRVEGDADSAVTQTVEGEAVRANGQRFPIEFISKPYVYQGRLVQVTGMRDITERKEMERAHEKTRELEVANRRLVEVDRMRTRILNVASHELNTPITPLRMQVHLLKTQGLGELNKRQLNAVEILERNLVRLSVLVKDILDVSKIEAGRLRLRPEPTQVVQVVEDTVDTFDQLARDRGISLEKRIEGEAWVQADSGRIAQVVSNLISNALKFTPANGCILVEARERDNMVEVSVKDDGMGLTKEQTDRLFQPFEQVHDLMEMTEGGSGLGLYISKGIVESHRGQMGIESDGPKKGVTAWFRLPILGHDAEAGAPETERPVRAPQAPGRNGSGQTHSPRKGADPPAWSAT